MLTFSPITVKGPTSAPSSISTSGWITALLCILVTHLTPALQSLHFGHLGQKLSLGHQVLAHVRLPLKLPHIPSTPQDLQLQTHLVPGPDWPSKPGLVYPQKIYHLSGSFR